MFRSKFELQIVIYPREIEIAQINRTIKILTDFDDTECPLRGAIYESRVAHLISKFCGYLYFLPYRDSHVHENLACRPYRSAPVDFCRLLKSQTDARKLLLILNVTAAFILQEWIHLTIAR